VLPRETSLPKIRLLCHGFQIHTLKRFSKYSLFLVTLLIAVLLASSCSRNTYPYKKKRKKRKCDCPEWSYMKPETSESFAAFA
jgi:hypothetical protein